MLELTAERVWQTCLDSIWLEVERADVYDSIVGYKTRPCVTVWNFCSVWSLINKSTLIQGTFYHYNILNVGGNLVLKKPLRHISYREIGWEIHIFVVFIWFIWIVFYFNNFKSFWTILWQWI